MMPYLWTVPSFFHVEMFFHVSLCESRVSLTNIASEMTWLLVLQILHGCRDSMKMFQLNESFMLRSLWRKHEVRRVLKARLL